MITCESCEHCDEAANCMVGPAVCYDHYHYIWVYPSCRDHNGNWRPACGQYKPKEPNARSVWSITVGDIKNVLADMDIPVSDELIVQIEHELNDKDWLDWHLSLTCAIEKVRRM